MTPLAATFTSLALLAPSGHEGGAEARLHELITSTSELDSFAARYVLDGAKEGSLEFWYDAPDRARLRISIDRAIDDRTGVVDFCVVEDVLVYRNEGPDETVAMRIDMAPALQVMRDVTDVLEEHFPPLTAPAPTPVVFDLGARDEEDGDDEGDDARVDFGLSIAPNRALAGWLLRLTELEPVTTTAEAWVFEPTPASHVRVSRTTGFIEELTVEDEDPEQTRRVTLEHLELDASIDADIFEATDAEDADEDLLRGWHARTLAAVRDLVYTRALFHLEEGEADLDDETTASLAAAWDLYAEARNDAPTWADYRTAFDEWLEQVVVRAHDELEHGSREALAAWVEQERHELERSLAESVAAVDDLEPPSATSTRDVGWAEAVLELEKSALRAGAYRLVLTPLLEAFDSALDFVTDDG